MALNIKTFTNADLNGSYQLVYTHNLNTESVAPTLYDNNDIQLITSDNFALGDELGNNKSNVVTLQYSGAITGTHKLLLVYQSAGETVSGRRAFELSEATPTDDFRVILGKAATPSINITLTNFFALLLTKLGFLKTASNLADLVDSASARTNLGVYSTSQVDTALLNKSTLYQTGSGAVLGVANTAVYTPVSDYHPATLKAITDRIPVLQTLGSVTSGGVGSKYKGAITPSVAKQGAGIYRITHNLGNTNYILFIALTPSSYLDVAPLISKNVNYADISMINGGIGYDCAFDYILYTW